MSYLEQFRSLIPQSLADDQKLSAEHFTRTRKLFPPKLITFMLLRVTGDKSDGGDIHSGEFLN